jgi:hypothetical protein
MKENMKYKWSQQLSIIQLGCCSSTPQEFNHLHCSQISFKIKWHCFIWFFNILEQRSLQIMIRTIRIISRIFFWTIMSVIAVNRSDGKSFVNVIIANRIISRVFFWTYLLDCYHHHFILVRVTSRNTFRVFIYNYPRVQSTLNYI